MHKVPEAQEQEQVALVAAAAAAAAAAEVLAAAGGAITEAGIAGGFGDASRGPVATGERRNVCFLALIRGVGTDFDSNKIRNRSYISASILPCSSSTIASSK
jgi:hypothetical protein